MSNPFTEALEDTRNVVRKGGLVYSLNRAIGGTLLSSFTNSQRAEVETWLRPGIVICEQAYSAQTGELVPDCFSVHITREPPTSEAFTKLAREFWEPYFTAQGHPPVASEAK